MLNRLSHPGAPQCHFDKKIAMSANFFCQLMVYNDFYLISAFWKVFWKILLWLVLFNKNLYMRLLHWDKAGQRKIHVSVHEIQTGFWWVTKSRYCLCFELRTINEISAELILSTHLLITSVASVCKLGVVTQTSIFFWVKNSKPWTFHLIGNISISNVKLAHLLFPNFYLICSVPLNKWNSHLVVCVFLSSILLFPSLDTQGIHSQLCLATQSWNTLKITSFHSLKLGNRPSFRQMASYTVMVYGCRALLPLSALFIITSHVT